MLKSRLSSILFWSVISAAFIGPGTLATASTAGADYGVSLLWTLSFAVLACILLQEAASRLTINTGQNLGQLISQQYKGHKIWIKYAVGGAVIFGCMAYQAGNILGAVSGIKLIMPYNEKLLTCTLVIICALLLWFSQHQGIAKVMGIIVAIMGALFLTVATKTTFSVSDLMQSAIRPTIPDGSEWVVIGLVGTTIVPYNLFLGSGISKGRDIREMRYGIVSAIILGGAISVAILLTGTLIDGKMSFISLANSIKGNLGNWAGTALGCGLFAAGFTSSITAPLAAGITASSIFSLETDNKKATSSLQYRLGWGLVLGSGLIIGLSGVKPIPVIILAQAVNGLLLPFISILILLFVNNSSLLPTHLLNGKTSNVILVIVVGITVMLGFNNLGKAIFSAFAYPLPTPSVFLAWVVIFTILTMAVVVYRLLQVRKKPYING